MEQINLTGTLQMAKTPEGDDLLILAVSPFRQYVIPLPDSAGEGAPPDAPSPKQIVRDALNGGVQIARPGALDALRGTSGGI